MVKETHKKNVLSTLALIATCFALGVIALGAFTRLIDAGLGCPDWPGCYGQLTVPLSNQAQVLAILKYPATPLVAYKAWAEMIHRYFVGGLSLFILGIVVIIFSRKKYRHLSNLILAISLILLLSYQIILGQLTVTLKLLPIIVTQHLLGGFVILSILWLIYLNNSIQFISSVNKTKPYLTLLPWGIIALIILLLQITLGAWTSTNYASLSCPDFPFCQNAEPLLTLYFKEAFNIFAPIGVNYAGGVLPEAIRQTIQMTHRLGALIFTLYIFIFSAFAIPKLKNSIELLQPLYVILGLLLIQVCVGIFNVTFKLPIVTAIAHNLVAVLLLLSVITFLFKLATFRKIT